MVGVAVVVDLNLPSLAELEAERLLEAYRAEGLDGVNAERERQRRPGP